MKNRAERMLTRFNCTQLERSLSATRGTRICSTGNHNLGRVSFLALGLFAVHLSGTPTLVIVFRIIGHT